VRKRKQLATHYSGRASIEFWRRVHKLPEPDHRVLYMAGCLLQTMEETILRWLANAEAEQRKEQP